MTAKRKPRTRGPGRLTSEETALLPGRLLDAALTVFARDGYGGATIDAIAREAGASRKTVYARYADKSEILIAAIERLLESSLASPLGAPRHVLPGEDARTAISRIASDMVRSASDAQTNGLNRLLLSEAYRDERLGKLAIEQQSLARAGLAATLAELHAAGHLPNLGDPVLWAAIFTEMIASLPRRHAVFGQPLTKAEVSALSETAVEIFLTAAGAEAPRKRRSA